MKMQIFLLSVIPVLALAVFVAVVGSFSDIKQKQKEWASFTFGQLLMLADGVRYANSDTERDAAFRAIVRAGFMGELRDATKEDDALGTDRPEELHDHSINTLTELAAQATGTETAWPNSEVTIALDKSRLLIIKVSAPRNLHAYGRNLAVDIFWITLLTTPVLGLSLYLSFLITHPLTRFTQMAHNASLNDEISNSFIAGDTCELRSLAESLNMMKLRVKKVVEHRAQMLRAMAHDLRTPLTRLRMRAEWCPDLELQHQMLLDIDTVTSMIDESMAYLKDMTADVGLAHRSDLTSLLQTIVSGFSDMGVAISFSGPARLPLTCKPRLLARAVSNLVENASRYAEKIEVVLTQDPDGEVTIAVNDNGPGLSNDLKLKVMEPFFKADDTRPVRNHGGVGLGLAIAYGVAGRHGGTLTLHDRQPHGLSARLTIRSLDELKQPNPAASSGTRKPI